MDPTLLLALVAAVALAISAAVTPLVQRAAIGIGLVAHPQADRWHDRPTPTFGGVAIFFGFGAAVLLGLFHLGGEEVVHYSRAFSSGWSHWDGLVLAGSLMFLAGIVDDARPMKPVTKLLVQVVAAVVLIYSGVMLRLFGIPAVDAVVSIFWFVGITNAVNLLDNMDGLAGGIAAIAAAYLGFIFYLDGLLPFAILAFALMGAVVGFLFHNYPPAKIFMGDSGSLFLGIVIAGLALAPAPGGSRGLFAVMALPVLILAIPILDTTLVTAGRMTDGRPVSEGGKDHVSHRLVALGLSGRRAVWLLWALAALSGGIGLLFRTRGESFAYLLVGLLVAGFVLIGAHLFGIELRPKRQEGKGERVAGVAPEETLPARFLRWHRHWPVLVMGLDLVLIATAYYAAYLIRWEDPRLLAAELAYFRESLPLVMGAKLAAFVVVGTYRFRWRHFGLADAASIARANVLASLVAAVLLLLVTGFGLSRGVLVLDFFVCTALIVGARFSSRILEGMGRRWDERRTKAVIVGSEDDALLMIIDLEHRRELDFRVVAVLNPAGEGSVAWLKGRPVYPGRRPIQAYLKRNGTPHTVLVLQRDGRPDTRTLKLVEECCAAGSILRVMDLYMRTAQPGELAAREGRTG